MGQKTPRQRYGPESVRGGVANSPLAETNGSYNPLQGSITTFVASAASNSL
jgi:hypothetical protein